MMKITITVELPTTTVTKTWEGVSHSSGGDDFSRDSSYIIKKGGSKILDKIARLFGDPDVRHSYMRDDKL